MLSQLGYLHDKEFRGFLERNEEKLGVEIRYSRPDVMIIGPIPAEMEYGADIQYIKFQGGTVLAAAGKDGEFHTWEQGESEGVQTFRLLDPRVYSTLLENGELKEKAPIPLRNGVTRVFADYALNGLVKETLKLPDEVAKVMDAMWAGPDEVAFDIGPDGLPQVMIRKELSPSEDEVAVRFEYS